MREPVVWMMKVLPAGIENQSIGGQWTEAEACLNIKYLELLVTF